MTWFYNGSNEKHYYLSIFNNKKFKREYLSKLKREKI